MCLAHLSRRLKWAIVIARSPSLRLYGVNFHTFDFSSVTGSKISTSLTKFVYFGPIGKWPPIGWDIFDFNETWHEGRSRPSLWFFGPIGKKTQDGRPGIWLAETFSTSHLKPLNVIHRNLTGSKISTFSTKFVFFGPMGKTRWLHWPLIGWEMFDFSSETTEQNSTQLDRKQDLNVLYQACVFRIDRKMASEWLRHFRLQRNLTGRKISTSSTKFVCFYAPGSNDRGHIVFVLSVCLFVCLSVVNFNLRYNFWTVSDRDFIFGMRTPLMMPFQMTPRSMTLWPWLWPWS